MVGSAQPSDRDHQATAGAFTVHYQNDIWDGRPMAAPASCRHPGPMAFPIGLTIKRVSGRDAICVDAIICMDCGADATGQVDLVEGLTLAYAEATSRLATPFLRRTCDLVAHRRADLAGRLISFWIAFHLGLTTNEISVALHAARVRRAAEYMGRRLARYTEAAR